MDKVKAKVDITINIATDNNSMVVYSSKVVSFIRQNQIRNLYDIELVIQTDSVFHCSV